MIASLVHASANAGTLSLRELAISLFLFITARASAHLRAKSALKVAGRGNSRVGAATAVNAARHREP